MIRTGLDDDDDDDARNIKTNDGDDSAHRCALPASPCMRSFLAPKVLKSWLIWRRVEEARVVV